MTQRSLTAKKIGRLYYDKGLSMSEIARRMKISIDAVVYAMRKHGLARRTFSEANRILFEKKKPSFEIKKKIAKDLDIAGAMLYWAEGYKSDKAASVDFANSDPAMIAVFMNFLRASFRLDESRLRASIYCYVNQNIADLTAFWSQLTRIPITQFTKPYIRIDIRDGSRIMSKGMLHIKYNDKKLLIDLKRRISEYKVRFLRRSDSGYSSGL